jgi:hypothetical protein
MPTTSSIDTRYSLNLSPISIALCLSSVAVFLTLMHILVMYAKLVLGHKRLLGLVRMFDLFQEANLPTWYSSTILLCCALLLGLIARIKFQQRDRFRWHWLGLTMLFVLLSMDESAMIHETVQWALTRGVESSDPYYSIANILYATVLVAVVVLACLRFLASLPRRTALLFIVGGALFVGGGLVVDYVGEVLRNQHAGANTIGYAVVTGIEETMEMFGVIVFIYALLYHLSDDSGRVRLTLPADSRAART